MSLTRSGKPSLRRLGFVWLCSLALFACSGVHCGREASSAPPAPKPDLRLLVLTDPKGYLEPCGCQQRPLGGVDKLASVVKQARAEGVPTLLVAAGDLLFGTELSPEDSASAHVQEKLRAETLARVWRRLGMAAATPGPLDLRQPAAQQAALVEAGGFPWLVDNAAPGAAHLGGARIVRAGDLKVGILGLVAPDPMLAQETDLELAADLAQQAEAKSQALREQGAQLVVALITGDRRAARHVAESGPDVVVMGGLDRERPLPPVVHGAAMIHAGRQGQRVVTVDLKLNDHGALHDVSPWTQRENQKARRLQADELRAKIAEWEKAKGVAQSDLALQRKRLSEMEETLRAAPPVSYEGRWLRAEVTELAPEVPGDPAVAETLDAHDRRVNEHNRVSLADRKPIPAPQGQPSYVGSEACQSCHQAAFAWWRSTKHGRAYATLERVNKQFNLSCVGCHVTGYNQPGGSTVTHVQDLKDVGCESCHGPGSAHQAQPEVAALIARDTPESVCAGCHTPEHSDRFVYEAFKTLLVVPGHGLPPKS